MAITYGMSVKEFWEDNPDLFWAYRFSYIEKIKTDQEVFNHNAWLQGMYMLEAVSVALNNSFSKSKVEYSNRPYKFEKEKGLSENKDSNVLVEKLKGRISEVQAILKNNKKPEPIIGESRIKIDE